MYTFCGDSHPCLPPSLATTGLFQYNHIQMQQKDVECVRVEISNLIVLLVKNIENFRTAFY